jgi:hypothetical protein
VNTQGRQFPVGAQAAGMAATHRESRKDSFATDQVSDHQTASANALLNAAKVSVLSPASDGASMPVPAIPIKDFSTRLFLLGQFVSHLESTDQSNLVALNQAGLSAEAMECLRNLTLADTARFAAGQLGISIQIDCRQLIQHLGRVGQEMSDRQMYEALIRRGASVRLVARLFGVSEVDVRRLRKLTAPESAAGGRPRLPDDDVRGEVLRTWQLLLDDALLSERARWWRLSTCFPDHAVVSLESVVLSAR